jgi:hypothetical protein
LKRKLVEVEFLETGKNVSRISSAFPLVNSQPADVVEQLPLRVDMNGFSFVLQLFPALVCPAINRGFAEILVQRDFLVAHNGRIAVPGIFRRLEGSIHNCQVAVAVDAD